MFNMSGGEIVIILLIVLMFFGSKSIPKIARSLGKGVRQVKDATQAIQRDIQDSTSNAETGVGGLVKDLKEPLKKMEEPLQSVKKSIEDSTK